MIKISGLSAGTCLQIAQLTRQGSLLVTAVLLAKSGITLSEIGYFEALLYIGSIVSFFWINGLLQGLLPVYSNLDENGKKSLLSKTYLTLAVISLLVFIIFIVGDKFIIKGLTGNAALPFFVINSCYLLFHFSTFLLDYVFLLKTENKKQLWNAFTYLLGIPAVLVPVWLNVGIGYSFLALGALALTRHIWLLLQVGLPSFVNIWDDDFKKYLVLSSPLILNAFIGGFAPNFDYWLAGWYYNGDPVIFAIFRYGAKELPLSLVMATAFSMAAIPIVAVELKKGLSYIKSGSQKLFHILFPVTIVLLLTSHWLFPLVYNENFLPSVPVFNAYLLLIMSRLIFPQAILLGLLQTRLILTISILEWLLKIVLSLFFIQWWGLTGLAWATVISFIFEKVFYIVILQQKYSIGLKEYCNVKVFGIYLLLTLVTYGISISINNGY